MPYACGIGMVHQHFKLIDVLSAAENVGAWHEGTPESEKDIRRRSAAICDKYGFDVDPDQKVYNMSVSQKQTVEIIKVLYRGADILILDEPTAVLTPQETEKLFAVSAEICETTARRSLSLPIKCMRLRACLTAWPCCADGSYVGDMATKETTVTGDDRHDGRS